MPNIFYKNCPICNGDALQNIFDVKDYTVSGKTFTIVHCSQCNIRLTQNVPDVNEIGAYYKSEDYISHTNTGKGLINKLYKQVRVYTMKQKAEIVKKYTALNKGNLLDIGCGTGTFLHAMQKEGWSTTGLEPDADARKLAKEEYNINALPSDQLFSLVNGSFDAITLWHVLEHVHSLHAYFEQIKKLLTPGGLLIIAVPNYTSKDADTYGKYWAGYDVPRHLYHFSPQSMNTLVQQFQLKIEKMLPMWFDSFYVSMLSSKYKTGKINYLGAFANGVASNMKAFANVEKCSSVIYLIRNQQ